MNIEQNIGENDNVNGENSKIYILYFIAQRVQIHCFFIEISYL